MSRFINTHKMPILGLSLIVAGLVFGSDVCVCVGVGAMFFWAID